MDQKAFLKEISGDCIRNYCIAFLFMLPRFFWISSPVVQSF